MARSIVDHPCSDYIYGTNTFCSCYFSVYLFHLMRSHVRTLVSSTIQSFTFLFRSFSTTFLQPGLPSFFVTNLPLLLLPSAKTRDAIRDTRKRVLTVLDPSNSPIELNDERLRMISQEELSIHRSVEGTSLRRHHRRRRVCRIPL